MNDDMMSMLLQAFGHLHLTKQERQLYLDIFEIQFIVGKLVIVYFH